MLRPLLIAGFFLLPLAVAAQDDPPPTPIRFEKGKSSATLRGTLKPDPDLGYATPRAYSLRASAGQILTVKLTAGADQGTEFSVFCPGNGGTNAAPPSWTATLPESGDYRIVVNGPGEKGTAVAYALEVAVTGKPQPVKTVGVTGTYRQEDDSSIEVVQTPDGKVRFYLEAFWKGLNWKEYGPNIGISQGTVALRGNKAVFTDPDFEGCTLTMTFGASSVRIDQKGDCGYGHNVTADGTYRRTSVCAAPERFEGL